MNFLNLGCGSRFHPAWTNVDFVSTHEGVIAHDLTQGISFADDSLMLSITPSITLFPKQQLNPFLRECCRVLRPKVSWELWFQIWSRLLNLFNSTWTSQLFPGMGCQLRVDCTEMYDQTVRTQSGGEMAAYLFKKHLKWKFIIERCIEAKTWLQLGVNTNNLSLHW